MSEQRLAGLSHQELWNLAHGGDPAASSRSQATFSRVAQVLGNVSRTIDTPLAELGLGWQGQAADAARAGMAQHARWADATAARAALAGDQAGQQAASARTVIAEMPPPVPAPPAGGAAMTGPAAADWAQGEQAAANARQRAVELMQGHAAQCAQTRPTTGFAPAPAAGAGAGPAGGAAVRSAGANGRGGAAVSAPEATTGAATTGAATTGVGGGRAGPASGAGRPPVLAASAASGAPFGTRAGARGASAGAYHPGHGGSARNVTPRASVAPVRPGRAVPYRPDAVPTAGPSAPRQVSGRAGAAPLPRRPVPAEDGGGNPIDTDPSSTRGEARSGPTAPPGALMPPMLGGAGLFGDDPRYHSPGFLLDDSDLFTDDGWVAPPVIGT